MVQRLVNISVKILIYFTLKRRSSYKALMALCLKFYLGEFHLQTRKSGKEVLEAEDN